MSDSIDDIESKLIVDAARNDFLSYCMVMVPNFHVSDFSVALCKELQLCMEGVYPREIIEAPPRHGKLISSDTPVLYKDLGGNYIYGSHGDLKPGFEVLHHSGNFYPILAMTQPDKVGKRVTFSTGESIDCHENHEWLVHDKSEERRLKKNIRNEKARTKPRTHKVVEQVYETEAVYETKELQSKGVMLCGTSGQRGSRYRWSVPATQAVNFKSTQDLPLDSYWFGYWLGDGRTGSSYIAVGKDDLEVAETRLGNIYKISSQVTDKNDVTQLYFKGPNSVEGRMHKGDTGYLTSLGSKHIPHEYLTSSLEDRQRLLAGLIDSDGSVDKNSRVRFSNCNKVLIDDVMTLLRGMNVYASLSSVEPTMSSSGIQGVQTVYQIGFQLPFELPTIYKRKAINRLVEFETISITDISDIPENEQTYGFCIEVASPDHTYVVGNTMVTTHNSFIISELAPAWYLGKWPKKKIIAASHTHSLAEQMGRKVRDYIASPLHEMIFGWEGCLNPNKAAAGDFGTNAGGMYFAVGVGGAVVGRGANFIALDDPVRNREEADNPVTMESILTWFQTSIMTRLEGEDSSVAVLHQRWSVNDLAGQLHKADPDVWRLISFPAVVEDDEDEARDYLGRSRGEVLIPKLHSYEKLMGIKKGMTPRDWSALYKQRPVLQGGNEFRGDMLQRYSSDPQSIARSMNIAILVDPANSLDKGSDRTAMAVVGHGADGNRYLLDLVLDKLNLAERTEALINLHRRWRPVITAYESYGLKSDVQHIRMEMERMNYRFPITELAARVKKTERIRRMLPEMIEGRWYVPEGIVKMNHKGEEEDVLDIMITEELEMFPSSVHDDAIDAMSRVYDIPIQFPNPNYGSAKPAGKRLSPW